MHYISWVQNPYDNGDGIIVIDEGFLSELPEKFKIDLFEYFKEIIKKTKKQDGK